MYRYTFYLDFLASELDDRAQNALMHLKEQSHFVRVLGSFPKSGQLIGPIKGALNTLSKIPVTTEYPSVTMPLTYSARTKQAPLKIGSIGFGKFGQFLAKTFVKNNHVYCVNKGDMSAVAKEIGCEFFPLYDISSFSKLDLDVVIFSVSIISFDDVLRMMPKDLFRNKLIVDVLSVKVRYRILSPINFVSMEGYCSLFCIMLLL